MLETNQKLLEKQIFKEFYKTPRDLDEYINILREWAKAQPHFPEEPPYTTLRFVLLFNKFSIEKAKQKLDMYYTIRRILPEFFSNSPFSPQMEATGKMWQIVPLPKLADNNARILYQRINPEFNDPKDFDFAKEIAHFLTLIEFLIMQDTSYRLHYIVDLEGIKMGHVLKCNPMIIKKASVVLEKVYSNNLSSIYLVNLPSFFEPFLNNVIKPALSPKLRERIKARNGTNILLEDFEKELMPKDIGGSLRSLKELNEDLWKELDTLRDRYDTLATLKVDESLRPTKLENDDILGFYGSFKKINVD